jgi:hypothetical protein
MNWPRVTVRDAVLADLPELQTRLKEQAQFYEQQDLSRCIVMVAEYDGQIVGFAAARLIWQVEPLLLVPEFKKHAPHHARQKATYLLIRAIDNWIGDRQRNTTKLHSYFCSIVDRTMRKLAVSFGMWPVYSKSKFFGRDT